MQTPYVQVQFKSRYGDGYGGNAYTYIADHALAVGDIVKVPTKYGDSDARVCRVDVPEDEVAKFHGNLRHITEAPADGGSVFDAFFN